MGPTCDPSVHDVIGLHRLLLGMLRHMRSIGDPFLISDNFTESKNQMRHIECMTLYLWNTSAMRQNIQFYI